MYCDGRAGEGGAGLRTVAADLPEGLLCRTGIWRFIYATLGNWEKALEEAREAMRLEPNNAVNYRQPRRLLREPQPAG